MFPAGVSRVKETNRTNSSYVVVVEMMIRMYTTNQQLVFITRVFLVEFAARVIYLRSAAFPTQIVSLVPGGFLSRGGKAEINTDGMKMRRKTSLYIYKHK